MPLQRLGESLSGLNLAKINFHGGIRQVRSARESNAVDLLTLLIELAIPLARRTLRSTGNWISHIVCCARLDL
jgi:hypothetical protein